MAVLQKIRVKFGVLISVIIALALLSFIIDPSTLQSALQSMSSKYDVGEIAGKSVSYTDFQEDVEKYTQLNEIITGSSAQDEASQANVRDAAWQSLIDKHLFLKNAKAAGIKVGDEEMVALTTGDMVSPVIAQSFSDENGNFDPSYLVQFVQQKDNDATGSLQLYWTYLQNTVYTQQFYNKYGALYSLSSIQNPLSLRNAIAENNNTSDVEFVMVPFGIDQDTTIEVKESEIKKYYKDHKQFFKQKANRDIEYVVFEVTPSDKDIAGTNDMVSDVYEEFANTDNVKSFLMENSDRPWSEYWYKEGELSTIAPELDEFAFNKDKNAPVISQIINKNNTFYVGKVVSTAMISDSAYVKHILLQGDNAKHLADSLLEVVKKTPAEFSNLAAAYSADKGSADNGELGNIGWMTQNYMISGMESVITAETGKPFILNTQYGTHVVVVSKKSAPILKKQVAILEKETVASQETFNEYYAKANKFAGLAKGGYDNYKNAIDTLGVYSHVMNNVTEATSSYGAVENAKEVTRWIFDAKKNAVSDIITVNNNFFFVAAVKDIHKDGYATVKEAASSINQILYAEKAAEKAKADVAAKIEGLTDLEEIAEKLNTTVNTQFSVAFANMTAQSLDPAFIGAVSVAPENKICGPVAGSIAIYVFKVIGRDTGSFYTEDDAKQYASQMIQFKSQQLLPIMMDDADVKDNRERFY